MTYNANDSSTGGWNTTRQPIGQEERAVVYTNDWQTIPTFAPLLWGTGPGPAQKEVRPPEEIGPLGASFGAALLAVTWLARERALRNQGFNANTIDGSEPFNRVKIGRPFPALQCGQPATPRHA